MNIFQNYNIYISLIVLGFVNYPIKFNCDGLNDYPSPIQFNNHIFRRIMSANESVDVAVETPTEKTFNNTKERIDENLLELYYSNTHREESVEEFLSKLGDFYSPDFGNSTIERANSILRLCNNNKEVMVLEENDILSQFLNADVSNVFSENKSLFKDLLNKDICATYEINFDKNSDCTLLTNKSDLQINKDISLLGNESEETNKLLDLWKRVVKNEENKFTLLKRNLYNQFLRLRNRSRLPHDKLNNILNECNMIVKKYNNNHYKTINENFQKWLTVTPHNIFEFKIFIMAYRLTWRRLVKQLHTEYSELLKTSFK